MRHVNATFVKNEIEPGWLVLSENVPLGKQYVVDLDRVQSMVLYDRIDGRKVNVDCVWVVSPGSGWLPLFCLTIHADA